MKRPEVSWVLNVSGLGIGQYLPTPCDVKALEAFCDELESSLLDEIAMTEKQGEMINDLMIENRELKKEIENYKAVMNNSEGGH